jgi:hypothetical protein
MDDSPPLNDRLTRDSKARADFSQLRGQHGFEAYFLRNTGRKAAGAGYQTPSKG